jgi:hypothetical protein
MTFTQKPDDRIDLTAPGHQPLATYRFGNLPKPGIHPLLTPRGRCLTAFEPSDHLWHRGLWFAIKFINGTNFWEERPPSFGIQKSRAQPTCRLLAPGCLRIDHSLLWASDASGPVIHEDRTIIFSAAPDGTRFVDWSTKIEALTDLNLDRTPFTTWGGYGGLYFRASLDLHDVSFLLPDGQSVPSVSGQTHDWTIMQGLVGGSDANTNPDQKVSIAMIDHPANPRSPTPWYNRASPGWNTMNPAFLFHEPLMLPHGQSLRFQYRLAYRDGLWDAAQFAALADEFRNNQALP